MQNRKQSCGFSSAFFCASLDKMLPAPMTSTDYRKSVVRVLAESDKGTELSRTLPHMVLGLYIFIYLKALRSATPRKLIVCVMSVVKVISYKCTNLTLPVHHQADVYMQFAFTLVCLL